MATAYLSPRVRITPPNIGGVMDRFIGQPMTHGTLSGVIAAADALRNTITVTYPTVNLTQTGSLSMGCNINTECTDITGGYYDGTNGHTWVTDQAGDDYAA